MNACEETSTDERLRGDAFSSVMTVLTNIVIVPTTIVFQERRREIFSHAEEEINKLLTVSNLGVNLTFCPRLCT